MGKYGKAIAPSEMPHSKVKRLPQYDEALAEFLASNSTFYEIDIESLPSQNARVVLSSLKWRIKNKTEFSCIKAVMSKGKIFLEKVES
jgi:hypothetical protein